MPSLVWNEKVRNCLVSKWSIIDLSPLFLSFHELLESNLIKQMNWDEKVEDTVGEILQGVKTKRVLSADG